MNIRGGVIYKRQKRAYDFDAFTHVREKARNVRAFVRPGIR